MTATVTAGEVREIGTPVFSRVPDVPSDGLAEHALVDVPRPQRSAIFASVAGKALELSMQALGILLVPRLLGPGDYGRFALALTVVSVGSSSISLSGPALMSRFVPAVRRSERPALARALAIRMGRWRALQVGGLMAVAAVLVAASPRDFPPLLTGLVVVALALDVAATLVFQVALGLGRTVMWSFRFALQNALLVAAGVAGHAAAGVEGAVAGIAIASGGVLAWGAGAVGGEVARARADAAVPPGAVRFAVLQGVSNVLMQLGQRGGVFAVALLAGSSAQTGFAALAYGIALAATYAVLQVFAVQLPLLVERGGPAALAERGLRQLAMHGLVLVTALAMIVVVLCEPALKLLLGGGFVQAAAAVAVAFAVLPLVPAIGVANQASALRLRPGARATAQAAGTAVFLATAVLCVPAWGAAGASAALLAGTAATVLSSMALLPGVLTPSLVAGSLGGSGLLIGLGLLTGAL